MTKARLEEVNGYGVLRSVLETACEEQGCGLGDLTVLSTQVDPYRFDTRSGHRDGEWVAKHLKRLVGATRRIHWRGLHYAIVAEANVKKPNGEIYRNTEDDWIWLSEVAGKAARWLGYIPFERIVDNRNAEPIICRAAKVEPEVSVTVGVEVDIPDIEDMEPKPKAKGFEPRQKYNFVVFGEKTSLEDVVEPIAQAKEADLYLPTGEISDTLLYRIAKDAAEDGRPLVMFTLADCDPAGRQMSVSIGRKLQAFKDLFFPDLSFEVVPVALTVEQVRELGLPSSPLKDTEKRGDRWREAFGVEQTEIDALGTLRPNALREILVQAFAPYFDDTLADRVEVAHADWQGRAQIALDSQVDAAQLAALRAEALDRLAEVRSVIDSLNERMSLATGDRFTLPAIEVPEPEVDPEAKRRALVSFDDSWIEATRALIARKQYGSAS